MSGYFATKDYSYRSKQVAGDGYSELWNDFGPKGKFFTRSLAPWGKMRKLITLPMRILLRSRPCPMDGAGDR